CPTTESFWIKTCGEVASTGRKFHFEYFSEAHDKHFEAKAYSPFPGQFAAIFSDLTSWLQVERELSDSEERFKALSNASFDGVIIHDQGLILECNQELTNITGFSYSEHIGMNGLELIAPESLETVLANIKGGYDRGYEVVGLRKEGSRYPLAIRGKNIQFQGREVRIIEFRDLTESKDLESQLRVSEERLLSITETAHDAIVMLDNCGRVIYWNPAAEQIFGYSAADVIGENLHTLIAPERYHGEYVKAFSGFQSTGQGAAVGKTLALYARHKDGHEIPIELSMSANFVKGSWQAVGIIRDISERRRLEGKTQQMAKLASLGEMASGVAHEINNPLTGIINCAQLLNNRLAEDQWNSEVIGRIIREGDRISRIVKSLLTIAHPGTGKRELVEVGELVEIVMNLTAQKLARQGIDFQLNFDDSLPPIRVEAQQIEQVLLNLLNNACYALHEKFPVNHPNKKLELNVAKRVRDGRGWILFEIRDWGTGISKEHLKRTFEPFFTTKPAGVGTGLGLGLCHSIVKRHSGRIEIESEFGQYTLVRFDLPIEP
ncbi:MAG: hypothetical protein C0614_03365, partial [Desulfuromonas sp.]